jgi:hypothetical protein
MERSEVVPNQSETSMAQRLAVVHGAKIERRTHPAVPVTIRPFPLLPLFWLQFLFTVHRSRFTVR